MKKIYLIILILFQWAFATNAQNYLPLPDSGAVWQIEYKEYSGTSNPLWWFHNYQFVCDSTHTDTTINSQSYHKLFFRYWSSSAQYAFAYRSDSLGRYWLIRDGFTTEKKLCDFSASVGDTIRDICFYENYFGSYFPDSTVDVVIDSVDFYQPFNRSLKVIYGHTSIEFHDNMYYWHEHIPIMWIEGIGNAFGFLNSYRDVNTTFLETILCFSQNDTTWLESQGHYNDLSQVSWQTGTCSANFNSVNDQNRNLPKIFPNPFSNYIRIENITGNDFTFELFDLSGRCLLRRKTNTPVLDQIPELGKGIYLLRWKSATDSGTQLMIRE